MREIDDLRKRGVKKTPKSGGSIGKMSPSEIQKLVQELHSHQIELEMQNQALRKAQVETDESQHKYSDLYDSAPVGYFTFDKKGHIIDTNVTGASLLGTEKRSLTKQPFQRFIVPGHLGIFRSHLQKAHESRSKQICKLKLTGKNSSTFDALINTIAVADAKGKFDHYRSSVTDITELARAEGELREIEARYQVIFDGAIEGIYRTTLHGENVVANPAAARILGYDSSEEVISAIEDSARKVWVDPDERSRFVRLLEEQGTIRGYECQFKKKDGTKIWVSLNSRAVRGTDGQLAYIEGFVEDITERKQAEETLRESEARLSLATEAVGAGLWIMEVDTGKVWVSPKNRELFHFAPDEEIHYESYFRVIHPEDRDRVHQEVQQALRSGENLTCDYRIVLPDGSIRWIVARGQRFLKSPREPARMMGLSFDITERKEIELQLRESQTLLSSLINSTPDLIWSVDAENFGLITFNRSLSEYFLHSHGIAVKAGMRPEDLLPADYAQQWHMFYRQALEEGSSVTEYSTSGGNRKLRLNINSLRHGDSLFGLSVFAQDITQRKRAEEALRESEQRMRDITFSMADWVWEVDENGVYTYSSSMGNELFGHVLGKTPFDFMPADEAKKIAAIFSEIAANRAPIKDLENWNIRKNGELVCLLTNGVPILDETGNLKGYRGVDKDITERKKMELQLSKSQTLLSTLINSTSDMIWSVDAEHFGILTFNRGLYERFLYAYGIQLKGGERPEDLFSSEDYVQQWHMLYRRALEEGSFTAEYKAYAEGRTMRLNLNILKSDDVVFGISVFSEDITERKRMEDQMREQLAEIEKLKIQLEKENIYLREEIKTELGFGKIIGSSDALKYVLFRAEQVAPTDATVLILGETGVGKGLVAHAIHQLSSRKDKPMITVNCAALPANLIESELFGREKGAFTGAHAKQVGRFEVADGGTIFLDEIGELPLELQAKLLRVLQDGEFERLGSPRTIKVDVRVITSTSRNLKAEMRAARFREDLYYRLNVFPVSLPPLRARVEDIPELANHFIDKYSRKFGKRFETIAKDTMQILNAYQWPGNVRELEHIIERAVITSQQPVFRLVDHLEEEPAKAEEGALKEFEEMAREHILQVLQKTRWKIDGEGGAAAMLGLNPSTLRFRIKKLGIKRP